MCDYNFDIVIDDSKVKLPVREQKEKMKIKY